LPVPGGPANIQWGTFFDLAKLFNRSTIVFWSTMSSRCFGLYFSAHISKLKLMSLHFVLVDVALIIFVLGEYFYSIAGHSGGAWGFKGAILFQKEVYVSFIS
jgi:hypothetical protein